MLRSRFAKQLLSRRSTKHPKARRRRLFQCLEDRRLLTVGIMTFDAGVTTTTSHTESGMTAALVDPGIKLVTTDDDFDGDGELLIHSLKSYGPYEFTLDNGEPFTLSSIEVNRTVNSLVLTSSKGGVVTLTNLGVHTFSGVEWTNITSFQASQTLKYTYIDNITFDAGTNAGDDAAITDEDVAVAIEVLGNDGVEAGGTLAIASVSSPNFGTAVIDDNATPDVTDDDRILYTPGPDDHGTATFQYTIEDGLGGSSTAQVTVDVSPINDPPSVDLNGPDETGLDFATLFTGAETSIADIDATLTDVDGGVIGAAAAGNGDIYVVSQKGAVTKIDPLTGEQTPISNGKGITDARSLAIDDATSDIYVVDRDIAGKGARYGGVVKVDPVTGSESVITDNIQDPWGIEVDTDGTLVVSSGQGIALYRIDPAVGKPVHINKGPAFPKGVSARGIAIESGGEILIAASRYLYRFDPVAKTHTALTTGKEITDVAVAPDASILITDANLRRISRIDPVTGVDTLVNSTKDFRYAIAVNADGEVVATSQTLKKPQAHSVVVIELATGTESVLSSGNHLDTNYGIDISSQPLTSVDNIAWAEIAITNLLDGTDEVLSVDTTGTDIAAVYDPATGILSLTGDDLASSYEAVLRTATYNNTSANPTTTARVIRFTVNDGLDSSQPPAFATVVLNRAPVIDDQSLDAVENATSAGSVLASDPDSGDTLTHAITGGVDAAKFDIDAVTGALTFKQVPDYESPEDADQDNAYDLVVTVTDPHGASDSASVTVNVLNEANVTGFVFADVDGNGVFDVQDAPLANVSIQLIEAGVDEVFGSADDLTFSTTTDIDGYYGFDDVAAGKVRIIETGPSDLDDGIDTANGATDLDTVNDQFTIAFERADANGMNFAEQASGGGISRGDTATIGFWHNKKGQTLLQSLDATGELSTWLLNQFGNIFDQADLDEYGGVVGEFYRGEFFKKKLKGTPKVDAQFMAVAFATFATSSSLSNGSATNFGFNVTETGIGATVVNVGARGAAFGVANNTDMSILALLKATNTLTGQGADLAYDGARDLNGDGVVDDTDGDQGTLDDYEKMLRVLANELYTSINEHGDI